MHSAVIEAIECRELEILSEAIDAGKASEIQYGYPCHVLPQAIELAELVHMETVAIERVQAAIELFPLDHYETICEVVLSYVFTFWVGHTSSTHFRPLK